MLGLTRIYLFIFLCKKVKDSALILLQTVPNNIRVEEIKEKLIQEIPGIISVHEMHIWELSKKKNIATAHIACESSDQYMDIAVRVKKCFHDHKIHSTTIQPEFRDVSLIVAKFRVDLDLNLIGFFPFNSISKTWTRSVGSSARKRATPANAAPTRALFEQFNRRLI